MNECWYCGQPGIPQPGMRRLCPSCDVAWTAYDAIPGRVATEVLWMGKAVPAVDFTHPGALSCPA